MRYIIFVYTPYEGTDLDWGVFFATNDFNEGSKKLINLSKVPSYEGYEMLDTKKLSFYKFRSGKLIEKQCSRVVKGEE